jgi:hypothetical protein
MRTFLVVSLCGLLMVSTATAQNPIVPEVAEVPDFTFTDKSAYVEDVIYRWKNEAAQHFIPSEWANEMRYALTVATPEQLAAANRAKSLQEVRRILGAADGVTADSLEISPDAIGSQDTDLVFFPLQPCRIIDTRLVGGMIAANSNRSFYSNNSNGSLVTLQGGSAADCGVPVDPAAIVVTFAAVDAQGPGNLRAWPFNAPMPNSSVINYGATGNIGLNIANSTILPICRLCGPDFTVRADNRATHLIADVVGYFWSPERTPVASTVVSVNASIATGVSWNQDSPACPASYGLTGGGFNMTGASANVWYWQSSPTVTTGAPSVWKTRGINSSGSTISVTTYGVCGRIGSRLP